MDPRYYAVPGPLTAISDQQAALVAKLDPDPVSLCRVAQGLVSLPTDAYGASLSPSRLAERNTRSASALLERATQLDHSPLDTARPPERRVAGTCRHFAVISCALLRATGAPARARCGFAAYFQRPKWVDHWVTEYWSGQGRRWVQVDSQILGLEVVDTPEDLSAGEFFTAGEAWQACRRGKADPSLFGVAGTDHFGAGEIRGNVLRDLAALNKVETLNWDEWGPMEASYRSETGADFDQAIDSAAEACAADDLTALSSWYQKFPVPAELMR